MPLIAWNDTLSVGVPEYDEQHKVLVGLINELHEAMSKGRGREVTGQVLTKLASYTDRHFADEERRMQAANYPDFAAHRAKHQDLMRQVRERKASFDAGKGVLTAELLGFLSTWLSTHIKGEDKKYAPFLK